MLKKFTTADVSTQSNAKSSVIRAIRSKILETFPRLESVIDTILPKKATVMLARCPDHVSALVIDKIPLFVSQRDGPWIPTLRVLHQYPSMMPRMQIDRGGIHHVLNGANVMCPGLTSKGGRMEDVPTGTVVQITGEGKNPDHAIAIGITTLSTEEIRSINKGVCMTTLHYLDDGLWTTPLFD